MRSVLYKNIAPSLGVAVGVGRVAHVLGLYARILSVDRCLDVLREDIVRHLSRAEPLEARTCLVAVPDLVCGTPACRCGETVLVAQFRKRVVMVCCMVRCRVHVARVHHRKAHPVVEHLAVFFQTDELLLAVHKRVVCVDQRLEVVRMVAESFRREDEVRVCPDHVEIFSRGGIEKLMSAPLVVGTLRVVVSVDGARCEVQSDSRCRGEVVGVVHYINETLVRDVDLVDTGRNRVAVAAEAVAVRAVEVLHAERYALSLQVGHHDKLLACRDLNARGVQKAVLRGLVACGLGVGVGIGLEGVYAELLRVAVVIHEVGYILEEGVWAGGYILRRDACAKFRARGIGEERSVVESLGIAPVKLHLGARGESLPVSGTRFYGQTYGRHADKRLGELDLGGRGVAPEIMCHDVLPLRGCGRRSV